MGGAMNYAKGRQAMKRMSSGAARAIEQNIIIKDGKGRYPSCFTVLPYLWCPKPEEIPTDAKNVPHTCKTCQEFLKSVFYADRFAKKAWEEKLKRMKEIGLPTQFESKM